MVTTTIGRQAEQAASEFLVRHGYELIDRNWKTRYCEIDIIARKAEALFFIEVKYRMTAQQGTGLEYITRAKLRRMRFAAEAWLARRRWPGAVNLAAIEICAPDFAIGEFIPSITTD